MRPAERIDIANFTGYLTVALLDSDTDLRSEAIRVAVKDGDMINKFGRFRLLETDRVALPEGHPIIAYDIGHGDGQEMVVLRANRRPIV